MNQYQISLEQSELELIDDMANCFFLDHFDPEARKQEAEPLLNMILSLRRKLNSVLTCERLGCGGRRQGLDDLCADHAANRDESRASWEAHDSRDSRESYRRDMQESGRGHLLRD